MVVYGTLKNGVVVLDKEVDLPEGLRVRVDFETLAEPQEPPPTVQEATVWQELLKIAGTVENGRRDGSANHDHYIYGTPKREPEG